MKIKHAFKIIFSGIMVKIKSGPLNGKRWIITSGVNFIKGTQELYKTEAFLKNFKKGEVFFDIGAHVGYFTAIAAVLNEGSGVVFAFEPRPMNTRFFKKHMRVNKFQNVTLYEAAVGESEGEVNFDNGHGSATGHVSKNGKYRVRQVSIDKMVKNGIIPSPGFIKIDVEGGEIEVLKGSKNVIATSRPKMIIATHNTECHNFVVDFLRKNQYSMEILNPDSLKGDTEIVALPN
jgi:FkbM family methyltransferase